MTELTGMPLQEPSANTASYSDSVLPNKHMACITQIMRHTSCMVQAPPAHAAITALKLYPMSSNVPPPFLPLTDKLPLSPLPTPWRNYAHHQSLPKLSCTVFKHTCICRKIQITSSIHYSRDLSFPMTAHWYKLFLSKTPSVRNSFCEGA